MRPGDAFLLHVIDHGFAFGTVVFADSVRGSAYVLFQSGAHGCLPFQVVHDGKDALTRVAQEVKAA